MGNSGCKIQIAFQISIDFGSTFLWFWMCTFRDVPRNQRLVSCRAPGRLRDHCFRGGTGTKLWRSEMKLSTESSGEMYEPKYQSKQNPARTNRGQGINSPALSDPMISFLRLLQRLSASIGSAYKNCAPLMGFKKRWIPQNK